MRRGGSVDSAVNEPGSPAGANGFYTKVCNEGDLGQSTMSPDCLTGLTIVVIEPHDEARWSLGAFLRRMGASPFLAATAGEGLDAITNCMPDLIMADIRMVEPGEYQFLQKIRILAGEKRRFVPVLAMIPMIGKREIERLHEIGFSACLPKPFSPARLRKTILKLTSHQRCVR
jgi:CheY-like chemotaxis protein